MDAFEAVDAIPDFGSRRCRRQMACALVPSPDVRCSVVDVPRRAFLADVRAAFASDDAVRRQIEIDAPRSNIVCDGARVADEAPPLARDVLPVCTQAVLGSAVEMLHRGSDGVLEPARRAPMCVSVSTCGDFLVRKDLRVLRGGEARGVRVLIVAPRSSGTVRIYYFLISLHADPSVAAPPGAGGRTRGRTPLTPSA